MCGRRAQLVEPSGRRCPILVLIRDPRPGPVVTHVPALASADEVIGKRKVKVKVKYKK